MRLCQTGRQNSKRRTFDEMEQHIRNPALLFVLSVEFVSSKLQKRVENGGVSLALNGIVWTVKSHKNCNNREFFYEIQQFNLIY